MNGIARAVFLTVVFVNEMTIDGKRMLYHKNKCLTVYQQVWCAHVGLKQVPVAPDLSSNTTTYLDVSHNAINSVSWQLRAYPHLKYLNLANNSLAHIMTMAFSHLSSLTELNLSWNKLKTSSFSDNTFKGLSNLRYLLLNHNLLGPAFSMFTFRHLHKITSISLDYNKIVHLTGNTGNSSLDPFTSLTELRLRGNFLLAIPHHVWALTPQLILLDLSMNSFTSIPKGSLSGLHALKMLLLNDISTLTKIQTSAVDCQNIKDLEIRRNPNLVNIQPGAFHNCQDIELLHLDNNALETLPTGLFRWRQIKNIYLNGNRWKCDCNATWLMYLAGTDKIVDGDKTECAMPAFLNHQSVLTMKHQEVLCQHGFNQMEGRLFNPGQIIAIILPSVLAACFIIMLGVQCFKRMKMKQPQLLGSSMSYGSLFESQDE